MLVLVLVFEFSSFLRLRPLSAAFEYECGDFVNSQRVCSGRSGQDRVGGFVVSETGRYQQCKISCFCKAVPGLDGPGYGCVPALTLLVFDVIWAGQ